MPRCVIRAVMPAPCASVFALLHDYERRLEWDTLLSEAYLEAGWQAASQDAVAVCRGRPRLGGFAFTVRYVTFRPPVVAAVELIEPAPFFAAFAAAIRHAELPENHSSLEYIYAFKAKPRWAQAVLHPLMNAVLARETRQRLCALARFLGARRQAILPP